MKDNYSTAKKKSNQPDLVTPADIIAEQQNDHRAEVRKLSDLAFVFLNASDGDPVEAETLLDNSIDLLLEDGVLSMWRYRIVLAQIREGL